MIIFAFISIALGMYLAYSFGRLAQMQKNRQQVSSLMDDLTEGKPTPESFGKFIGGLVAVATQDKRFGKKIARIMSEHTRVEQREEA